MINRLVYEVRLVPLAKENRSKIHKKWRWDVDYYLTTDPVHPGVEDGRYHLGGKFGYERFWLGAMKKISDAIRKNIYRKYNVER